MRTRKLRLALALLLLALFSGLACLIITPRQPPEPIYQGKRLSEWLRHKANGDYLYDGAEDAIQQIGTNAIPTLLKMTGAQDSTLKLKLVALARKQHFVHINFVTAEEMNSEACLAFAILGPSASNAVPSLIQFYEKRISESSRLDITSDLAYIGPAAAPAVPVLLRTLSDTNSSALLRASAANALGEIHTNPRSVVPVLIQHLNDFEPRVRAMAALALASFGKDAGEAVPALVNLMKDPVLYVRNAATQALQAIDPEAAAKAGVK